VSLGRTRIHKSEPLRPAYSAWRTASGARSFWLDLLGAPFGTASLASDSVAIPCLRCQGWGRHAHSRAQGGSYQHRRPFNWLSGAFRWAVQGSAEAPRSCRSACTLRSAV